MAGCRLRSRHGTAARTQLSPDAAWPPLPLSPPPKGLSVLPPKPGAGGVAMSIPGRSTLPEGELEPGRGTSDDGNVRHQSDQVRVKQRRDPSRDEFQTQAGGWSLRFSNRHRSSDPGHRPSLFRESSHAHRPLLQARLHVSRPGPPSPDVLGRRHSQASAHAPSTTSGPG
jgi:hypothetical protein